MNTTLRTHTMFSLEQAVDGAPVLAVLQARIRESQQCLEQVRHLIPPSLHPHVKAGPLQDAEWCLLVSSAAASTKLRQLLPALQQVLTRQGHQVSVIRIKVHTAGR